MMKYLTSLSFLFVICLICFFPASARSSDCSLSGRVTDSKNKPVAYANVALFRSDSTLAAGDVTDATGAFRLIGLKSGRYRLKISFVGYREVYKSIVLQSSRSLDIGSIALEGDERLLSSVVVRGKVSDMRVQGDTLEFNAANFGVRGGDVLEDLVKRLPGAEIGSDGKITVNGKEITKIMVDGKEFFSGDTKVASKNLPADMIEKIQISDRLSELARLSGFDDGEEETVLNLTIKKGQKKGFFGNTFAGYGSDNLFEISSMTNRFWDDNQWSLIASANNTNNQGFSDLDIDISQTGGGMDGGGRPGSFGGGTGRPGPPSGGSKGGITTSSIVGANTFLAINARTELNADGRYGYADRKIESDRSTRNLLPGGNYNMEEEQVSERSRNHNAAVEMRLVLKHGSRTEIVFNPSVSLAFDRKTYNRVYHITDGAKALNHGFVGQFEDRRDVNISGHLDISHRIGDNGRVISGGLVALLRYSGSNGIYHTEFESLTAPEENELRDLNLDNLNRNNRYRIFLSWVEPLGKNFFLQGLYNLSTSRQSSDRKAYTPDAANAYTIADPLLGSDFASIYLNHRLGLNVKKIMGKADLTVGLNYDPAFMQSRRRIGDSRADTTIHFANFSPMLRYNYSPVKNTSLRIGYRGRMRQPDIRQMIPVPDVTNPLSLVIGNPGLRASYTHFLFARLQYYAPKTRQSISASLFANYVLDDVVSNSLYDYATGKRTTRYENVSGNTMLAANVSFTSPFFAKPLSLRLSANVSRMHRQGFINGQKNIANTLRQGNRLSFVFQNSFIYSSLGGNFSLYNVCNTLEAASLNPNTYDYGAAYDMNLNLPLDFRAETDLNWSANNGYGREFRLNQWIWNAALSYSFLNGKAATLRLKVYDILSQRSSINRNATDLAVTEERTNVLGRYVMLHFIYRFSIFSGGGSRSDMRSIGRGHR